MQLWELQVSTNRQIVLIRVEEVVQVVYGHHQIRLMDEAGGGHAVVSGPPLSICTAISSVNVRDLRRGSSPFHRQEMNTESTLQKAIKHFSACQTDFNVPPILPIFMCNFKLKEIIELSMARTTLFWFHSL